MKITFALVWYDLRVGAYWQSKTREFYICPFPCVVFCVKRSTRAERAMLKMISLGSSLETAKQAREMSQYFSALEENMNETR